MRTCVQCNVMCMCSKSACQDSLRVFLRWKNYQQNFYLFSMITLLKFCLLFLSFSSVWANLGQKFSRFAYQKKSADDDETYRPEVYVGKAWTDKSKRDSDTESEEKDTDREGPTKAVFLRRNNDKSLWFTIFAVVGDYQHSFKLSGNLTQLYFL